MRGEEWKGICYNPVTSRLQTRDQDYGFTCKNRSHSYGEWSQGVFTFYLPQQTPFNPGAVLILDCLIQHQQKATAFRNLC